MVPHWVPPLIIHNLHVKFESDLTKTVVCTLSTMQNRDGKKDAPTHSLTQPQTNGRISIFPFQRCSIINLIINLGGEGLED